MGWSHALFICQKLHERLVVQSGISDMDRLQDRRPIQQSECLHLQYVDNLVVLGTDEKTVTSSFRGSVEKLKGAGLQVHEVELGNEGAQVLGWAISSDGKMRPTEKRFWKVRLAIRELLKRGRASPRQIEKLLGHCCFISLAKREALSIFGHVYSFVHRNGDPHKEVPLWPTVRKEFDVWDGILPLIWRDYTSPWSEKVYAVDASEWGLGCTAANMDVKMVQQIGSFCERWRFKDPLVAKARANVEIDPHDMYPVQLPLSYDDTPAEPNQEVWQHFMPVPFEAVQREWKTVGRHKWLRQSSMPVSEARATLYAVKHMLRGVDGFGRRHLVLTDSMTAACAFSRGRAHTWELRRVCQQFGALTMATSCHVHLRWVPSEWNPADSPSRGGWAPSIPSRFFGNGDSQDHSVRAAFEMGSSLSGSALSGCKVVEEESKHLSPFDFRRMGDRNQPYAKKLEERRQKGSEETPDTTLSQTDNPPTAFGFKQLLQPISGTLGSGEKHGASSFRSFAKDFDHRSTAGESFGDFVPGGGGREHWSLCHSRGDLFQTRVEVTKDDQSANLQAEPMWLEQTLSSQKPPSSAVGSY